MLPGLFGPPTVMIIPLKKIFIGPFIEHLFYSVMIQKQLALY